MIILCALELLLLNNVHQFLVLLPGISVRSVALIKIVRVVLEGHLSELLHSVLVRQVVIETVVIPYVAGTLVIEWSVAGVGPCESGTWLRVFSLRTFFFK